MKKFLLCLVFTVLTVLSFTAAGIAAAAAQAADPAPLNSTEELLREKLALSAHMARSEKTKQAAEKAPVPVLNYHSVSDVPIGIRILSVTTEAFENQMKYLVENGYTPIDLKDNPAQYDKPVIITFDDGYEDNYFNVYPILEKYNIRATIFLITGLIDTPGYLTTEQIKRMKLVSFQSHTVTHRKLPELSEEQILSELWESQIFLTRLTGKHVYAICYPVGKYSDRVIKLTSRYYRCAVTIQSGIETKLMGNYRILRPFISRDDTLADFARELKTGQ